MSPPGHQAPHPLQDPLYASPRPPYPQSATMLLFVDVLACCCWSESRDSSVLFVGADGRMRDALNQTGRPIVFYMCVQGQEQVQEWCAPAPTATLLACASDCAALTRALWRPKGPEHGESVADDGRHLRAGPRHVGRRDPQLLRRHAVPQLHDAGRVAGP